MRASIKGVFGVPGENDNGRRILEFCAEHKSLHKYTKVARDKGRVEVKSRIDLAMVKRDLLRYMEDVRTV